MTRRTATWAIASSLACLVLAPAGMANPTELVVFSFEQSLDGWSVPDWAKASADYVGQELALSQEVSSDGKSSLRCAADFPGERWTGAYVERVTDVTDWSTFGHLAVDIFLPAEAPRGLGGRIILTVGESWTWTESNRAVALEPGQWTTLNVDLTPHSLDWKFFPTEAFRRDIRKVGVRVESNQQPKYAGPVYLDKVRLSE